MPQGYTSDESRQMLAQSRVSAAKREAINKSKQDIAALQAQLPMLVTQIINELMPQIVAIVSANVVEQLKGDQTED